MDTKISYWKQLVISWQDSILHYIPEFVLGIAVLIIFIFIARYAKKYSLQAYVKTFKTPSSMVANIIASSIYFFFLGSGIALSLQILGLEQFLTKLLTGAGIVGIIAGFAFKDVASNLFASMLLKVQLPFRERDWVELNGVYGVVTEIGWITTCIKTVTGEKVYVPNQTVYNANFKNYSAFHKRRVVFESGVSYGDNLDLVKKVALEEVKNIHNLIPEEDIDFFFTSIGGYSYNFQLRFWIRFDCNKDYREAMSQIIMKIKRRFEDEDISLAYQVMTLDFAVKGGTNIFDRPLQVTQVGNGPAIFTTGDVMPPVTPQVRPPKNDEKHSLPQEDTKEENHVRGTAMGSLGSYASLLEKDEEDEQIVHEALNEVGNADPNKAEAAPDDKTTKK